MSTLSYFLLIMVLLLMEREDSDNDGDGDDVTSIQSAGRSGDNRALATIPVNT